MTRQSHQRVLSLSIAYVPSLDRHAMQIAVPLGIAIPKGVIIKTDSYTSPALNYRRCDRNGCYVEMAVDNALVEASPSPVPRPRSISWPTTARPIALNFSLKGFAAAHDDMVEPGQAKAKAVAKPGTAAPAGSTGRPTP